LLLAGLFGFGCAVGVHFFVGYNNLVHLLPGYLGILVFVLGIVLAYGPMVHGTRQARLAADTNLRPRRNLSPRS
jgi:hypothetical protein